MTELVAEKTPEKVSKEKSEKQVRKESGDFTKDIVSQKATSALQEMSLFDDIEREFSHLFPTNLFKYMHSEWPFRESLNRSLGVTYPSVDIIDREKEVCIKAELPGIEKKDISISMNDNSVTIKGNKKTEVEEEKGDYYRREVSQGAFSRTMMLPCDVNTEKCKATFTNGVLEIVVPKKELSKRKTIEIK